MFTNSVRVFWLCVILGLSWHVLVIYQLGLTPALDVFSQQATFSFCHITFFPLAIALGVSLWEGIHPSTQKELIFVRSGVVVVLIVATSWAAWEYFATPRRYPYMLSGQVGKNAREVESKLYDMHSEVMQDPELAKDADWVEKWKNKQALLQDIRNDDGGLNPIHYMNTFYTIVYANLLFYLVFWMWLFQGLFRLERTIQRFDMFVMHATIAAVPWMAMRGYADFHSAIVERSTPFVVGTGAWIGFNGFSVAVIFFTFMCIMTVSLVLLRNINPTKGLEGYRRVVYPGFVAAFLFFLFQSNWRDELFNQTVAMTRSDQIRFVVVLFAVLICCGATVALVWPWGKAFAAGDEKPLV